MGSRSATSSGNWNWVKPTVSGVGPEARWKHSATQIDDHRILMFGGFKSATCRLNDVWILDFSTPDELKWVRPYESHVVSSPRGGHSFGKEVMEGAPPPRGAHTATMVASDGTPDKRIFVFGGYGGTGYARRDMQDLYVLDVAALPDPEKIQTGPQSTCWKQLSTKGKNPERRSGHQSCAVHGKMYVFGGWNNATQFSDLYVLDVDALTWTLLNASMGPPRWNHSAFAVMAIPNWKIFMFGGVSGNLDNKVVQGNFMNDVAILDTGNNYWVAPEVHGTPPAPRSSTDLAYDNKGSRLVLFGGWANKWFDDVYCLDVGCIVGPPYAILDIEPKLGPVTGGTKCVIQGIDFIPSVSIIVRFSLKKKGSFDVKGTFVSTTEIHCEAPNFSKYLPGEVDVRVSFGHDSFTTTFEKFTFFAVTDAQCCIVFGPGVLRNGLMSQTTSFLIQVRAHWRVDQSRWSNKTNPCDATCDTGSRFGAQRPCYRRRPILSGHY
jgi:dynein heavy chain